MIESLISFCDVIAAAARTPEQEWATNVACGCAFAGIIGGFTAWHIGYRVFYDIPPNSWIGVCLGAGMLIAVGLGLLASLFGVAEFGESYRTLVLAGLVGGGGFFLSGVVMTLALHAGKNGLSYDFNQSCEPKKKSARERWSDARREMVERGINPDTGRPFPDRQRRY